MRAFGNVRRVDRLGRISLPTLLRSMYNIKTDDSVEMYQEGDSIIMKKYLPKCIFCGSTEKVETHKGRPICQRCRDNLSKY